MSRAESAQDAYDRFAAVYDECTAENDYELWLGETLLPELEELGLQGGRVLDVGCGTGRAFEPLLSRGWGVVGCDVSAAMLERAREKFAGRVDLFQTDARDLPQVDTEPGDRFQLVLMLNDVLNYVTEEDDLRRVFAGIERNLNPSQGLVAFDVNTLALFRQDYAEGPMQDGNWEWRGMSSKFGPGLIYESRLSGPGVETHVHRQRHWPAEPIRAALAAAGLRCRATLGQREEAGRILLSATPDEERDAKVIYVASR
jgi:SAM-dependent methyltransferase